MEHIYQNQHRYKSKGNDAPIVIIPEIILHLKNKGEKVRKSK